MATNTLLRSSFNIIKSIRVQSSPSYSSIRLQRFLSDGVPVPEKKEIEVTFIQANGERIKAKGKIGDSLLDVVVNSQLPFDGFGACEGTLTCSTCHLIFKEPDFKKLPDDATSEEMDMLELACETGPTSRLGCQVYLSESLKGLEVRVPAGVHDIREE